MELRRAIKSVIDMLPPEQLSSATNYVNFLVRPELEQRIVRAEKAIAKGKGFDWRKA